jgi:hypothetical protein
VLEELIVNKVTMDPKMIQKSLEIFFNSTESKDGVA